MLSVFSLAYNNGNVLAGGNFLPAGSVACMALSIGKDAVTSLDALYTAQKETGDTRELRDSLSALDCVEACSDLLPDDCSAVLDELICFRVYIRHFLQKYCADREPGEAWEEFLDDLDGIAEQLRRMDNLGRTVLHPDFDGMSTAYRVRNGELCEIISMPFGQLLLFDLLRALENGHVPKRCPCCGRWFIPQRSNEVYCSGLAPDADGRTCRELGAGRTFSKKSEDSEQARLCRSLCSRIYTRKNRGKLTPEEAAELTELCRSLRDQVTSGEITLEQMQTETTAIFE